MTDNIKLPKPDTHCHDEDTRTDVWSYSAPLVRIIIEADRLARPSTAPVKSVEEDDDFIRLLAAHGIDPAARRAIIAHIDSLLAARTVTDAGGERVKQLEHVILATSDDLAKLHAEFGFPDDEIIDTEDMIKTLRVLRAEMNKLVVGQFTTSVAPVAADHVKRAGRWHMDAEQFAEELRQLSEAYPIDIWPELTAAERESMGVLLDRASAAMGRHFSEAFKRAANLIERSQQAGDALDGIAIGYEHGAGMKNPYTMGGLVTLSYDTPEQGVAAMAIIRAAIDAARASAAKVGE